MKDICYRRQIHHIFAPNITTNHYDEQGRSSRDYHLLQRTQCQAMWQTEGTGDCSMEILWCQAQIYNGKRKAWRRVPPIDTRRNFRPQPDAFWTSKEVKVPARVMYRESEYRDAHSQRHDDADTGRDELSDNPVHNRIGIRESCLVLGQNSATGCTAKRQTCVKASTHWVE